MPTILILVSVLGVFLLAFLLFRTAVYSREEAAGIQASLDEVDAGAAAGHLGRLIQCKTVSALALETRQKIAYPPVQELASLHKALQEMYPRLHRSLRVETLGGYSLLYTWPGSNPGLKPILLLAHQDVTPVEEETAEAWQEPPFSGRISGGYVWGRGALDFKCGLVGAMEAVETLLGLGFRPQRSVYLAFGHDEEVGGLRGARQIAQTLQRRGITFESILDEGGVILEGLLPGLDRPAALVGMTEKGYLNLEITAASPGGHASAGGGDSAASSLCRAVGRIEDSPLPANRTYLRRLLHRLAPALPFGLRLLAANDWLFGPLLEKRFAASSQLNALLRTTAAVTLLQAGVKDNVLPRQARALANLRLFPGDRIADVTAHYQRAVQDKRVQVKALQLSPEEAGLPVRAASRPAAEKGHLQMAVQPGETQPGGGWESPPESEAGSPSFRLLETAIRLACPGAVVAPFLTPGATDSRHYAALSGNIYRFMAVRLSPADLDRIHGSNERIAVEELGRLVQFMMLWIRLNNLASQPE